MNAEALMAAPVTRPGALRTWLLAARPATLVAAVVPVAVGSACAWAESGLRWSVGLAALLGAVFIQVGTNFANDVYDFEKGADTGERLGPTRAVQAGLLSASQMRAGMWVVFAAAVAAGAWLTALSGPWVIGVGLVSIACGIAYTGGPYPLGYNGLGDAFVFAFFGPVAVCGTALAHLGRIPTAGWVASLPVGALATGILVVNNLRDCPTDARAGKRTLAVRWGERAAVAEYALLLVLAYAAPLGWALDSRSPWALLPWVTAPWAVRLARAVATERGRALNGRLAGTAKLLVAHGLLWAVGLGVGR